MANSVSSYNPAAQHEFQISEVEYRHDGGESLLARIFQPSDGGPYPLVLQIHGGAWNSADRTSNPALSEGLAASGLVVASIDFRMGGQHPYPSSLVDINYATRWLKAHAAELNALPEAFGGLGVSSGGHLIMLSAMRPRDPRYSLLPLHGTPDTDASLAYVITCWGVLDPYGRYVMAREQGNQNLVANHDRYFLTAETMQEANPLMILQRHEQAELPPALLIQGTADEGVPKGMVENVASLYQAAGGEAELALFEGMPHGIAGWPAPEVARMVERMKGFIAKRLPAPLPAS